jgi:hypothetical protein
LIPAGALVTVPVPVPLRDTPRVKVPEARAVPLTLKLSILPVPAVATVVPLMAMPELSTSRMYTVDWLFRTGTPLRSSVLLDAVLVLALDQPIAVRT